MFNRHLKSVAAVWSLAACTGTAFAHEAWVQPGPGPFYPVEYGYFTPEAYPASKVKSVTAFDLNGKMLKSKIVAAPYGATVSIAGKPAVVALHFDNGFYSSLTDGTHVNLPKSKVPGATRTSHPIKYGKTILLWSESAYKPLGLPIEIVPVGAGAPKRKAPMTFQVLLEGKPLADAELETVGVTAEGKGPHTDADGMITADFEQGIQRLAVQYKLPTSGEADVDSKSITAALLFVVE